jgi:hypothetical protein
MLHLARVGFLPFPHHYNQPITGHVISTASAASHTDRRAAPALAGAKSGRGAYLQARAFICIPRIYGLVTRQQDAEKVSILQKIYTSTFQTIIKISDRISKGFT